MSETSTDPMTPVPIPEQVPAKEGFADIPGARLFYWDTGGNGVPVVFLHPATGSALIWLYQQPAFAKSGYRVIAYSRRDHYNSSATTVEDPGVGSVDLRNLMEFLGVKRFHVVGSAAGGSVATDFAFSYPEKLFSLTVSSNNLAARNGYISHIAEHIRPEQEKDLPRWFWELGPSYRAANPAGVEKWNELNRRSVVKRVAPQQRANEVTPKRLETLKVPTLLITGTADLVTPPSIMRMIASHVPSNELVIISESGHSPYWEQPEVFNRILLDFVGRHST